jgi:hypothetical protein
VITTDLPVFFASALYFSSHCLSLLGSDELAASKYPFRNATSLIENLCTFKASEHLEFPCWSVHSVPPQVPSHSSCDQMIVSDSSAAFEGPRSL